MPKQTKDELAARMRLAIRIARQAEDEEAAQLLEEALFVVDSLTERDYRGWRSRTAGPELEGFSDIKPGYTLLCREVEYRPPQDGDLVLAVVEGEERFGWLVRNGDTWYLENQHGARHALPGPEVVREVVVHVLFDPFEGEDAGAAAAK